ncbi:MAG TPA: type II secretion system F family protein [Candidatus Tectomicrobia bacterium]|nr:type II secretion system F family protein [Candidatus Tectomicrobia bacterium]
MALLIGALVFVAFLGVGIGIWWALAPAQRVESRLRRAGDPTAEIATEIFKADDASREARLAVRNWAGRLAEQAGYPGRENDVLMLIVAFGALAGAIAWMRMGFTFVPLCAVLGGAIPVGFLMYRRYKRVQKFEMQFPDALDMMTRAMRAGHALTSAIRVVGQEMPDPIGHEFRVISEEVQLGLDPGEALERLESRLPTEDVRFFSAAVQIQRSAGGNLAEILERLSEVIRERFKLLSHARVLSAQHRMTAICVGLSPIVFSIMFELMRPGYFKPLLESPAAPFLIGAGLLLELIGFLVIWRIATIKF